MVGIIRAYKTTKTVDGVRAHHLYEEEVDDVDRFFLVESRYLFFIIDHDRRSYP